MKKGTILSTVLLSFSLFITEALSAKVKETEKKKQTNKTFSNSFKISGGYFYIKDRKHDGISDFSPIEQIGACFEKKAYKNFYVGTGFYKWQAWQRGLYDHFSVGEPLYKAPGSIEARIGYKMIDAYSFYRLKIYHSHAISLLVGASYCWGTNLVIKEWYYIPTGTNQYEELYTNERVHARYWGGITQISYDYLFLNNRLCAGLDCRIRWYQNRYPAQEDIAMHIGINF